jgi:ERCC4-type nuclease
LRTILCDTRQKKEKNEYIDKQLEALGYRLDRCRVYAGDYVFADNGKIAVDTKQDLQEVCGNVTQQHKRFQEECERAKSAGIKLVILIKDASIKSLDEVPKWYNWRLKVSPRATNGKQLWRIMTTMSEKYGVEWRFATPSNMGKTIVEILEESDGRSGVSEMVN